jgi:hypothetical protein
LPSKFAMINDILNYLCEIVIVSTNRMLKKNEQCLDEIIRERRSTRGFKEEYPQIDEIKQIIRSGLLAPYAAQAVGVG